MRIAVFVKKTTFHKGSYGLETQNKQLVEALVRKGHEIVVYTPKWELQADSEELNGVQYVFLQATYRYLFTFVKNHWKRVSYKRFVSDSSKNPFDVVLSQSSAAWGLFANKKDITIPIISVAHGSILGEASTYYKDFFLKKKNLKSYFEFASDTGFIMFNFFTRQRVYVHGSDKVICVSNRVKKALMDETFVNEDKLVVVHNGIDPAAFYVDMGTHPQNNKVLYIGAVIKSKGVDTLYEISLDDRFKDVIFEIVGDGEYLDDLKKKNKNNNFILHGKLPYEQITKFYNERQFKALAFPTKRFEGLPMVLIEALFGGVPVVAFDNGGVADAVLDNKTGFLISPNDVEEFKLKLLSILNNSALQNSMALESIKFAQINFTADIMVEKYEEILKHENS